MLKHKAADKRGCSAWSSVCKRKHIYFCFQPIIWYLKSYLNFQKKKTSLQKKRIRIKNLFKYSYCTKQRILPKEKCEQIAFKENRICILESRLAIDVNSDMYVLAITTKHNRSLTYIAQRWIITCLAYIIALQQCILGQVE